MRRTCDSLPVRQAANAGMSSIRVTVLAIVIVDVGVEFRCRCKQQRAINQVPVAMIRIVVLWPNIIVADR